MKWLINALTAIGGSDRRVPSTMRGIAACVYMSDEEFLWEEVFNWYEEQDSAGIFLDAPPAAGSLVGHCLLRNFDQKHT
jgi:hypothetical protein